MDGTTISFSRKGAKLGAVLSNGTYIWNIQSGEWCLSSSYTKKWVIGKRRSKTLWQPVYLLYCLDVIYGVFLLKLEV